MQQETKLSPKPRKLARGLALTVFGLLVGWLGIELFMRVGFDLLPPGVQAEIQNVRRVPWAEETIIPAIPFIIDHDFQVRLDPGLRDFPVRWSDARFTFSTISAWEGHRAGLRSEPPNYPLDVMTFGDSFAFCWVAWESCWVKLLEAQHGWHLFNAAIPGTGPTGQLNLMKELTVPMKPRLIVWLWYANDLSDDYDLARIRGEVEDLGNAPYPDPVAAPVGLAQFSALADLVQARLNPPKPQSPYRHYQEVRLNGRPASVHTNEYANPYALVYPDNEYGLKRNLQAYTEAARFLKDEIGAQMLIVFLPIKEEAYYDPLVDLLGKDYLDAVGGGRRALLAACAENGWHCLDATPILREAASKGQTVFYAYDSHLDPSGNQLLAAAISEYIAKNNLLSGQ